MTIRYVMQVWFDRKPPTADYGHDMLAHPAFEWGRIAGVPLWQAPDGKGPVYSWAIDYVVCGDHRMCVFGPFATQIDAAMAYRQLIVDVGVPYVSGYRVIPEHCFAHAGDFPRRMWTDG